MHGKAGRKKEFEAVLAKVPASPELIAEVEAFAARRTGRNRAEAVRQLLALGLAFAATGGELVAGEVITHDGA